VVTSTNLFVLNSNTAPGKNRQWDIVIFAKLKKKKKNKTDIFVSKLSDFDGTVFLFSRSPDLRKGTDLITIDKKTGFLQSSS
jgi:hypothetical protein